MVSLITLALGVPSTPKLTARAIVLHLPSGFMPVEESALRSKDRIVESLRPHDWWPHVAAEKADPE